MVAPVKRKGRFTVIPGGRTDGDPRADRARRRYERLLWELAAKQSARPNNGGAA